MASAHSVPRLTVASPRRTFTNRNQMLQQSAGGALVVEGTLNQEDAVSANGAPARMVTPTHFEATIESVPGTNAFTVQATDLWGNVKTDNYDEPLSKETDGVSTYYRADGLGSIVKETSAEGEVTNTLRYDAWGNIEAGARDGFAFTGREWDPETELYYYRARYYDPKAGRFISDDPIGLVRGVNMSSYVEGNPVAWTDPLGLTAGNINLTLSFSRCFA